jgi:hypothetical protein
MSKADGAFAALTKRWVFVTAQTDAKLVDVGATQKAAVLFAKAVCSNSNTGDVSIEIGFGTATLPTISNDSLTGGDGVFLSHPGIAKGGGEVNANSGQPIATGAVDQDIRLTCSAATGGAVRVIIQYRLIEDQ